MFCRKLNELFEILGATGTKISEFAGCDRSLISRLKSGNRVPRRTSESVKKLINGIFMFADDKNGIETLLSVLDCNKDNPTPEEIKQAVLEYLYEGQGAEEVKPQGRKKHKTTYQNETKSAYGKKLDAVINIADISNVRLAKLLHIDASTISRFRKGMRMPKPDQQLAYDICDVLFERVCEIDRLSELMKLSGASKNVLADREECRERFRNWLCNFNNTSSDIFVEKLLDNISSFSTSINIPLPTLDEAAPEQILSDQSTAYYNTEGIRRAVMRFLGNAIKNRVRELWLYSDQNMEWLTNDMSFRLKWMSLMSECVKSGIRIKIIHNIDRGLEEMVDAINSWLPLYMSGMIESYYCKKQTDGRFSTTLFLCPEMACISSCHACGCEDKGIYRYDTDEKTLSVYEAYYKKLLASSSRLVKIYQGAGKEKSIYSDSRNITAIVDSLSLETMPKKVAKSIIERSGQDEKTKKELWSEWEAVTPLLEEALKKGYVHECISLKCNEEAFSNNVAADFKAASLTYTDKEYKEHIKNIISISEENSNYRFYLLPESPFNNIGVAVSEDAVIATRLLSPRLTFVFSHPLMCEAFMNYVNQIKDEYNRDKITTKQILEYKITM